MGEEQAPLVFVSHSGKDALLVKRVVELLQVAFGLSGKDILCSSVAGMGLPSGAPIATAVLQDIQQASAFLVMLSPASLRSQFVQQEVGVRLAVQKPIVPLLKHGLGAEKVRGPIADLKKIRLLHCDKIGDLFDLVEDLGAQIGRAPCRPSVCAPHIESLVRLFNWTTVSRVMLISVSLISLLLMGNGYRKTEKIFVGSPPRPPALQITRVDDKEVHEGQKLTVSPVGTIAGSIQQPAETYPVKVTTSANDRSWEPRDSPRFPPGSWTLQNVRFREPANLEETYVKVTVEAGTPPALISRSVDVKVPAPVVTIGRICGQDLDSFQQGCGRFTLEGTAVNVLETEEQVWTEVNNYDRNGDFHGKACFQAGIRNGRWTVSQSWPGQDLQGTYRVRFGLVAGQTAGHDCPADLTPLDQIEVPRPRQRGEHR